MFIAKAIIAIPVAKETRLNVDATTSIPFNALELATVMAWILPYATTNIPKERAIPFKPTFISSQGIFERTYKLAERIPNTYARSLTLVVYPNNFLEKLVTKPVVDVTSPAIELVRLVN